MKYDVTTITAAPGEIIEIVFINDDAMQHNLLVATPGSLRKVGMRAEEFAKEKKRWRPKNIINLKWKKYFLTRLCSILVTNID